MRLPNLSANFSTCAAVALGSIYTHLWWHAGPFLKPRKMVKVFRSIQTYTDASSWRQFTVGKRPAGAPRGDHLKVTIYQFNTVVQG